eukprot:gene7503-10222_t
MNRQQVQAQNFRHARRLYVGGFPINSNFTTENELREYLCDAISRALGEPNNKSNILSVYIDHSRGFAFIELKSVALTEACLQLDGLRFKTAVLRVLRAKEFNPADLANSPQSTPVHLDLSRISQLFAANSPFVGSRQNQPTGPSALNLMEPPAFNPHLETVVQKITDLSQIKQGSVVIIGFPFDSSLLSGNPYTPNINFSKAPSILRNLFVQGSLGLVYNPEFHVDLSRVPLIDVGDIYIENSTDDPTAKLPLVVEEVSSKFSIPFVVGGSFYDINYYATTGLYKVHGPRNLSVINIGPELDSRIVEDTLFCPTSPLYGDSRFPSSPPDLDGRFIQFGGQGSQCTSSSVQAVSNRNGKIYWFNKDLKTSTLDTKIVKKFKQALDLAGKSPAVANSLRSVVVHLDLSCLCLAQSPTSYSQNTLGFSVEDVLEMSKLSGEDPNVCMFTVSNFVGDDNKSYSRRNLLLSDILYKFTLGYASRMQGKAMGESPALYLNQNNTVNAPIKGNPFTHSKQTIAFTAQSQSKKGFKKTGEVFRKISQYDQRPGNVPFVIPFPQGNNSASNIINLPQDNNTLGQPGSMRGISNYQMFTDNSNVYGQSTQVPQLQLNQNNSFSLYHNNTPRHHDSTDESSHGSGSASMLYNVYNPDQLSELDTSNHQSSINLINSNPSSVSSIPHPLSINTNNHSFTTVPYNNNNLSSPYAQDQFSQPRGAQQNNNLSLLQQQQQQQQTSYYNNNQQFEVESNSSNDSK